MNAPPMVLAECRHRKALLQLEPEWTELWNRTPHRTPFQSPIWVLAWLRHFGTDEGLRVLTVRRKGTLTAILPLTGQPGGGTFSIMGAGVSDYLGGCVDGNWMEEPSLLYAQALHWPPGTKLDLQQLQAESPFLTAPAPEGFEVTQEVQDSCPILSLPASAERLYERLAPKFSGQLSYARRRLSREFTVEFSTANPNNCEELMEAFIALHARRWNERAQAGVLAAPEVLTFHRNVATSFAKAGLLRLHLLRLNGQPASAVYGFRCGEVAFFYLSGFDPQFQKHSVGTVALDFSIRQAIAEGCSAFNFLRGREAYKYRWGARDSLSHRRILELKSPAHGNCSQPASRRAW